MATPSTTPKLAASASGSDTPPSQSTNGTAGSPAAEREQIYNW